MSFPLACRVSIEKSADSLMSDTLYIIFHFLLIVLNILSLSFTFVSLVSMCLGVFLLGFILPGTLCFPDLADCFLSHVKEVFSYYVLQFLIFICIEVLYLQGSEP